MGIHAIKRFRCKISTLSMFLNETLLLKEYFLVCMNVSLKKKILFTDSLKNPYINV